MVMFKIIHQESLEIIILQMMQKKASISKELDEVKSKSFIQKHPKSVIATVATGVITGTTLGILSVTLTTTITYLGIEVATLHVFPAFLGINTYAGVGLAWGFIGLVGGLILGVIVSCLCKKPFPKSK